MVKQFNITGELTQELVAAGDEVTVRSVSLSNVHADTTCTLDLYLEKKLTGKFYIMKTISLPVGVTLSHDVNFNNGTNEWGLYIKLTKTASETPAVDVIIN